jgi:coenzyme Q-binding protein COQ10
MSTYREEREVPYPAPQLFDLVADVESYPDFLPWWAAARIVAREDGAYRTDQVIRFGPIRQRFPTRTVLRRPREIDVTATGGPFRRFDLHWSFAPLASGGCRVGLDAEIAFRLPLLGEVFGAALGRALARIVTAFEVRARMLYGPPGSR